MFCFLLSNRDFLHPFHARILQGAETHASAMKQHVLFSAVHYSKETPPDLIPIPLIVEEKGWTDGLILAGAIYPNFLKRIISLDIPFVAFGNNVFGVDGQRQGVGTIGPAVGCVGDGLCARRRRLPVRGGEHRWRRQVLLAASGGNL